ncbi:hypothetical protein [Leifsonia sp. NPDC058248]|uniref:hypothetical protein n=1 Tax=Leifsonia sp. NPDC058248 TaxID=3346402 RepID=UPI0036D8E361
MPTDTDPEQKTPWYRRGKAMIVSAGAVAAAGLAIFGFWDRIFPPDLVDSAKVESVDLVGATTLRQFAFPGTTFPLKPAAHAAGSQPAVEAVAALPTSPPAPPPADPKVAPPGSTPTPSPTLTETPSPTATPSESTPPATPGTSPALPGTTFKQYATFLAWPPPDAYLQVIVKDPVLTEYAFTRNAAPHELLCLGLDYVGQDGEPLDPQDVAQNLKDSLDATDGGDTDPLGWTVAVDVSVEGLNGVPLLLTWSLDGTDVPVSWSTPNVAYRVVATTPRDSGSARIWVPNLKTPGAYRVNVTLVRASDGTAIAHGKPVELPNP